MPGRRSPVSAAEEVLLLLADGRPRTRAELAVETELSRATIATQLDALVASGLVTRLDDAPSSGGRPAARLALDPRARSLLAIDLGAAHATVALTDLDGRVLAEQRETIVIADGPHSVLNRALDIATALLEQAPGALGGVGVGVPGPVEHATGRPVKPPIMPGWDRFDIPGFVSARLPVPVLVDNDVNLLALGEHADHYAGVDDLLYVKVSTGIGAGIVSGGALQRGALGAAGDLGHVHVPGGRGETELEAIASGSALARRLAEAGRDVSCTSDVVALLAAGDPAAVALTREAGRDLGEVLATCVNLLNPSVIVVGGSIAEASHEVLAGVREIVYRRSLPLATRALDIVQASGGGGVRGAALMVRRHLLSPAQVARLLLS
ncbi:MULTISPECIES: ROK family transcriptional regulator [unclassified Rathayibacter]|uniref:ROK family transcriptional regulator n=1 Tax=unclassified Rathayibacter TaxID=2609250 RepID=UPI00188B4066|nr:MULTISPECIES: ROK family transcriptional regulator [unclassified Rathayibacter]MBF4462981.1 ROK family transcriptional regulator [Rathayibacter sp. VKM Ac-2879]MBF4504395.1 ROK family transcriptional regulator [Rathayibacter sp. VKM Ac-2878]